MSTVISLSSGREVRQVVGMVFSDETCRLSLVIIIVRVIFIVDFGLYVDKLISWFPPASLTWPSLENCELGDPGARED